MELQFGFVAAADILLAGRDLEGDGADGLGVVGDDAVDRPQCEPVEPTFESEQFGPLLVA
jgi:hypothetical protein